MELQKKYIIGLTIFVCVLLIFISYLVLKADTKNVVVSWNHYSDYGSPDAEFIKIYELKPDSTIKQYLGAVSVNIDSFVYPINFENRLYYFGVTAVDSSENENRTFPNVAILDSEAPINPLGTKARWEN